MKNKEIIQFCEAELLNEIKNRYELKGYTLTSVNGHEGGRNVVYIAFNDTKKYVLRISSIEDRKQEDFISETEFVHYLAVNGADVADVISSRNGKLVEHVAIDGKDFYISVFEFAKGILISENNYKYRDNAAISEYFYNTGKTLGKIHKLSKQYKNPNNRIDFFEHYNMEYLEELISDEYINLKASIRERLERFKEIQRDSSTYGLVHFDFSDGNYHIDYSNGKITVFDFENCCTCWYMFDLANLWTHGVGWISWQNDIVKRKEFMSEYFDTILQGYKSETVISEDMLVRLPVFIDMVLIENIVDEFECCMRAGVELDYEDIEDAANALINNKLYAGFFE